MGQVTGQITLDGQPVTGLIVTFHPQARADSVNAVTRQAMGETDAEGRFALGTNARGDGAAVGKHRVVLVPGNREKPLPGKLPDDYEVEVEPGDNTIDIQLLSN